MDKLTAAEASRVVSVLDDALERLMLMSYVPEREAHASILAELGQTSHDSLSAHWRVEQRYHGELLYIRQQQRLQAKRRRKAASAAAAAALAQVNEADLDDDDDYESGNNPAGGGGLNGPNGDLESRTSSHSELDPGHRVLTAQALAHKIADAANLADDLRLSCRGLCRTLRDDPPAFGTLQTYTLKRSPVACILIDAILLLKRLLAERLARTVEDDAAAELRMTEASTRTASAEETKAALSAHLHTERVSKDAASEEGQREVDRRRAELSSLNTLSAQTSLSLAQSVRRARDDALRAHESSQASHQARGDDLEHTMRTSLAEHGDGEALWHKKGHKAEEALANSILRYDTDMNELQRSLDEETAAYDKEYAEHAALSEYFEKLDRDLANEADELHAISLVALRKNEAKMRAGMVITKMQAIWRGRQERLRHGKRKKKKKGKKGKGKKKKK